MSDNAAILASALTSLTGSQVITQSDYLRRSLINKNNATYLNINPVSLHNSYLAGGAVSNIPQQNNEVSRNVDRQQHFHIPNPQVISHPSFSPQSPSHSSNFTCFPTSITN